MQSFRLLKWSVHLKEQAGLSLVEVLAGVALTVMISMVVTSLLFSTAASGRMLTRQTDEYESLRIPAAMFMNDARFAFGCGYDPTYLRLYTSPSGPTDYIQYTFTVADGGPDPNHLHRWVVQGGVLQRDDIVGWNLLPPNLDWWSFEPGTTFGCSTTGADRKASVYLAKPPLPGQEVGVHLEVMAFHR